MSCPKLYLPQRRATATGFLEEEKGKMGEEDPFQNSLQILYIFTDFFFFLVGLLYQLLGELFH